MSVFATLYLIICVNMVILLSTIVEHYYANISLSLVQKGSENQLTQELLADFYIHASLFVSHTSNLGVESNSDCAVRVVCCSCHFSSTAGPMPAGRTHGLSKARHSVLKNSTHHCHHSDFEVVKNVSNWVVFFFFFWNLLSK